MRTEFLRWTALAGGLLLTGCGGELEDSEEADLHSDDPSKDDTSLLGTQSWGHAAFYCGHGVKYHTVDNKLHKSVFLRHVNNRGGHRWKSAHYMFTGTGYTRVSGWYYFAFDCH